MKTKLLISGSILLHLISIGIGVGIGYSIAPDSKNIIDVHIPIKPTEEETKALFEISSKNTENNEEEVSKLASKFLGYKVPPTTPKQYLEYSKWLLSSNSNFRLGYLLNSYLGQRAMSIPMFKYTQEKTIKYYEKLLSNSPFKTYDEYIKWICENSIKEASQNNMPSNSSQLIKQCVDQNINEYKTKEQEFKQLKEKLKEDNIIVNI